MRFITSAAVRNRTLFMVKNHKDPLLISYLSEVTAEAEKGHIMKILKTTKGNRMKAAELLGISRKTLWEKIKSYDIKA